MGGSGSSSKSRTYNSSTVNATTNVDIDLVPLGEILAQSQENSANIDKETAKLELINGELDRIADTKTLKQLDGYLEKAKNGIVLSVVVASGLYLYKNKSKKRKK